MSHQYYPKLWEWQETLVRAFTEPVVVQQRGDIPVSGSMCLKGTNDLVKFAWVAARECSWKSAKQEKSSQRD